MKNKKVFLLLGAFWLIIIVVFVGSKEYTLRSGREVLLKTQPVDPRDLFRGDYVILNYEISTIDLLTIGADPGAFTTGEHVYISLDPQSRCAKPIMIDSSRPLEGLYMKGKVQNISGSNLTIEYGIENYFVPEGKGREIEELRGNELVVKASVDGRGSAAIKEMIIKGNECR